MNPDKSEVLSEFYIQQFAIRGQDMGSKYGIKRATSTRLECINAAGFRAPRRWQSTQHLTKLLVGRGDKLEIVTPPKFGVIVTAYNRGR